MICFGREGTTTFTGGFFLPSLLFCFSKLVVLGMYCLAEISDDFIAAVVVAVFAVVSSVEKPNQLFRFSSCFLTVCSSADSFRSFSSISFKVLTSEDRRCFSSMNRVVNCSFSLRTFELSSVIIRIASLRPTHCCSARLARCSLSLTCVERCSRALSCFSFFSVRLERFCSCFLHRSLSSDSCWLASRRSSESFWCRSSWAFTWALRRSSSSLIFLSFFKAADSAY
mmetsp:Transcript_19162/g.47710  ORF Transcript_19162/g.47710 Transcript_19162/m.47710 type:complete len:226 (+) Transcript_19162:266-943(+)